MSHWEQGFTALLMNNAGEENRGWEKKGTEKLQKLQNTNKILPSSWARVELAHSSNLCPHGDNTGSLTCSATTELQT